MSNFLTNFFNPYKGTLCFPLRMFFHPQVMKIRAIADNFHGRSWASGVWGWLPTDPRIVFYTLFAGLTYARITCHNFHMEEYERTLTRRWGGSPASVREQLSPEDQIRARQYIAFEYFVTIFKETHHIYKPRGYDPIEA